jgi:hypothetical protein
VSLAATREGVWVTRTYRCIRVHHESRLESLSRQPAGSSVIRDPVVEGVALQSENFVAALLTFHACVVVWNYH